MHSFKKCSKGRWALGNVQGLQMSYFRNHRVCQSTASYLYNPNQGYDEMTHNGSA